MAEKVPPRIPAGMRDILPESMLKRQYVIDVVRGVFEEFGFDPLQTSAIELTETMTGKYGEDAERLIYKAWYGDTPGDEFSLRYDLSVPLSRVVAMYPELPRPFKRYQIAPVWRADRPQKGRYREFFQCDVDTVGPSSMLADAEIVAVMYEVLVRLGFGDFTVAINNRKILDGIGQYAGVPASLQPGLYRSIDKLDKIGLDGVQQELLTVGLPDEPRQPLQRVARLAIQGKLAPDELRDRLVGSPGEGGEGLDAALVDEVLTPMQDLIQEATEQDVPSGRLQAVTNQLVNELAPQLRAYYGAQVDIIPQDAVARLLDLLQITGPTVEVLDDLAAQLADYPRAMEGIDELRALFGFLDVLGVPESAYEISFAMVRGLEYYTGPIFETTIRKPKAMPSIIGGGRYDELIGMFSDVSYPATGTSFGIERIIDAMDELDMFPPGIRSTTAEVLVTIFNADTANDSLKAATMLRQAGIRTTTYFDLDARLGEQIGYASAKGIPFVVILGPDEIAAGQATVRRLGETREESEQRVVPLPGLVDALRNW
jgi:histidyl-tRNA synthetase